MKENSIEENIKEIECFFKRNYFVNYDWTIIHRNSMANLEDSIEDILSDYKRVLKKNKDLKENCKKCIIRDELDEYVNNSIPIQKIKDKIEELKKNLHTVEHYEIVGAIHVLQELLEKEK